MRLEYRNVLLILITFTINSFVCSDNTISIEPRGNITYKNYYIESVKDGRRNKENSVTFEDGLEHQVENFLNTDNTSGYPIILNIRELRIEENAEKSIGYIHFDFYYNDLPNLKLIKLLSFKDRIDRPVEIDETNHHSRNIEALVIQSIKYLNKIDIERAIRKNKTSEYTSLDYNQSNKVHKLTEVEQDYDFAGLEVNLNKIMLGGFDSAGGLNAVFGSYDNDWGAFLKLGFLSLSTDEDDFLYENNTNGIFGLRLGLEVRHHLTDISNPVFLGLLLDTNLNWFMMEFKNPANNKVESDSILSLSMGAGPSVSIGSNDHFIFSIEPTCGFNLFSPLTGNSHDSYKIKNYLYFKIMVKTLIAVSYDDLN